MPQTVIEAKKIYVSDDVFLILEQLKIAGRGNFDDTELAILLTQSAQIRSLGFKTLVPRLLERILPLHLKGTEITWPEVSYDLDVESREIWIVYRSFLDERLRQCRVNGPEIGGENIEDSKIFIVEILLRMTLAALSLSITKSEKSKKIIDTVSIFVLSISNIGQLPKNFMSIMRSGDHCAHWPLFRAIIESNEIMHAHKNAISKALNVLLAEKHLIICRLIAELSPERTPSELTSRLAAYTLLECQRAILQTSEENSLTPIVTNTDLIYLKESNLCSQEEALMQTQIIKMTNNPYIKKLYGLLNKNALIVQMLSKVEKLVTLGSWFPFVSGLIDSRKLANYLQAHYDESQKWLKMGKQDLDKTPAGDVFSRYHFEFLNTSKLDSSFQNIHALHTEYFKNRLRQIGIGIFNDFAGLQKVLEWDLTHPQLMHGVVNLKEILPAYDDVRKLPSPQQVSPAPSLIAKASREEISPDFIESLFYSPEKSQRNKMRKILEGGQLQYPQRNIVGKFIKLQKEWKGIQKCLMNNEKSPPESEDIRLRNKIQKYHRICEELSIQIRTFCQSNEVITCFSLWRKKKMGIPKLEHQQPNIVAADLPEAPAPVDNLKPPAAAENRYIAPARAEGYLTPHNFILAAGIVGLTAMTYDTWSPLFFRGKPAPIDVDPILSTKVENGKAAAIALLSPSGETLQSGLIKASTFVGTGGLIGKALINRIKNRNQSGNTAAPTLDISLPRSVSMTEFPEDYEKNTITVTNITKARALSM